jgi:hypothetical protein
MACMLAAHSNRVHWMPATVAERDRVRDELEAVLSSQHFCNSKRYPALLRYVVEHALSGDVGNIKERTLGIEVFGRPADYDTNSDTVVRYTAGEVRRRLAMYYHEHDDTSIQITLTAGSYVPEFLHIEDEPAQVAILPTVVPAELAPIVPAAWSTPQVPSTTRLSRRLLWLIPAILCVAVLAVWLPVHAHESETAALDHFWGPVLREKKVPLLVSGGVVFSPNLYSGTQTADRSTDYPFLSMQIASAMARVSGLLQKNGSDLQMLPANTTTLSDLRDRPVILIGAYNNEWTVRLSQPLPFRLGPASQPSIVDAAQPAKHWERDHNLPYSSSDDYALIGRYRDQTSGSVTVVVAGLGRNGTEAASQFLTDPHYMQQLEQHLGHRIDDHNLEAVLKINVIQGRTGAPSIMTVHTW